jgi:hypothetical protein
MKNILFKEMQGNMSKNPGQWLMGLLGLIAFFFVLFWLMKGVFTILSFIAPVLLILTAIINYRVITDYVVMLWSVFKNNWIVGILGAILTVVGFPFVSGFLFAKALLLRKVGSIQAEVENQRKGEFVEYEDLTPEPDETLILKEPEPQRPEKESRYDEMF